MLLTSQSGRCRICGAGGCACTTANYDPNKIQPVDQQVTEGVRVAPVSQYQDAHGNTFLLDERTAKALGYTQAKKPASGSVRTPTSNRVVARREEAARREAEKEAQAKAEAEAQAKAEAEEAARREAEATAETKKEDAPEGPASDTETKKEPEPTSKGSKGKKATQTK